MEYPQVPLEVLKWLTECHFGDQKRTNGRLLCIGGFNLYLPNSYLSFLGVVEALDELDSGALPRATRANKGSVLPGFNDHAQMV